MGKKVKSLLRVFFPNKKKKKDVSTAANSGNSKASATKSSSVKEEQRSSTTSATVNNPSSTKLKLIVDANSNNPTIGNSTDLTIDPTFSSSSTPSSLSPTPSSTFPVSNTEEEEVPIEEENYEETIPRSRTSTSTSGDLSFERHLAAATVTTATNLTSTSEPLPSATEENCNADDSLLIHLDEETLTKVRAFEQSATAPPHPYSKSTEEEVEKDDCINMGRSLDELVSSAVFEETLTNLLHRRRASSSGSGSSNSADIDAKSFDETVESHEMFNYRLENSITETQLEYVNGGLYVEDTEEEEVGSDVVKDECFLVETDNVESEEIKCGVEIECKVDKEEFKEIEEVEEIEPSCPSPIRGGGGCCSTLPEVTAATTSPLSDIEDRPSPKARTTAAIEEAAFETSRSSRMEGVRAALEEATRKEEDEDFNVEEEIESPPSPAVTVEEVPNEEEEEKVVRSSSPAKVSPPTTTVDGGSKSSSSTEALAWTALSALMTAPAPQAIQQKKTRTPTNLWQHGELGEDQAGEIESDLDNISIACSSIACSDTGTADISLRDDDGYMDLVSAVGVEGGVEVVADDIVPQVEEDKGAMDASVNQSIESNESSSTTTTAVSSSSSLSANKSKKVQFSLRGEQARQRAIARQKKILSKASLRLGAISETSLENIEEHDQLNLVAIDNDDCDDSVGVSSSMPSLSFAGDTDMDSIMEGSELASIGGGGGLNDCSSSVRSVVSHQVIGEGKGGICSISFYEAAASEGNKKLLDNSSELLVQEEETKKDEVVEPVVQGDNIQSSPEVQADVAQVVDIASKDGDKQDDECIEFFVLLLCPTSRIFELVEIKNVKLNSTVQDIMDSIPQQCTDERLLSKSYTGFVRPTDRIEFMQMDAKAFEKQQLPQLKGEEEDNKKLENSSTIQEDDVLVAILEGYTGYQMIKISKPILKNSKFRDMLSRRSKNGGTPSQKSMSTRRSSSGDDKSTRSSRSVRSSHSRRKRHNRSKRRSGESSLPREIAAGKSRSSSSKSSSKYSSITQKLEDLSKKLHDVDDEIEADDQSMTSGKKLPSTPEKAPLVKEDEDEATIAASILEEVGSSANLSCYKMTPKMVAYELASNIEDIFADHDVDIVAVDSYNADFNLEDDDIMTKGSNDDTFVSARSMLNMSDARSIRSLARQINSSSPVKPVLEITTKKKRERKSKPSKYSNYEEDDMMLQIEAMARQADEAFQSRKKMSNLWDDAGTSSTSKKPVTVSREKLKEKLAAAVGKTDVDVTEKKKSHEDTDSKAKAVVSQEDDKEVAGITAGNIASAMVKKDDTKTTTSSNTSSSERTFLNTSTSMVSTMVAASQGRVNEVHVLQYLGVTIVCIAANFMQHTRKAATGGGTKGKDSSFIPKTILESAMFLAFMVNGQRYLAKVTKKEKKEGTESI